MAKQRLRGATAGTRALALAVWCALATLQIAAAQREIYSFSGPAQNSAFPHGTLIRDAAGALYGTTFGQPLVTIPPGSTGAGAVYKLTPPTQPGGAWTYTVLHAFNYPAGLFSGVIQDSTGTLYGVTYRGGQFGKGAVFSLKPPNWSLQVLHSFSGTDGANPSGPLVFDPQGRLWGTTQYGGSQNEGTVFRLVLGSTVTFKSIYSFTSGADGAYPHAGLTVGLIVGATPVLYGTTAGHNGLGPAQNGTVFVVADDKVNTIFTFNGHNGTGCSDGVIVDSKGALYGTTFAGGNGASGLGTVFKLTPTQSGPWTHTILHSFNGTDGANPWGTIIFGPTGELCGTTSGGTHLSTYGTFFKLIPPNWTFQSVPVPKPPLKNPEGGLMYYGNGLYIGTTYFGGASGFGDVFTIH